MGIYTNLIIKEHIEKIFYHGLRTNGFVILAGLTGTGKTKLFEQFELYSIRDDILNEILNNILNDILNTEVIAHGQVYDERDRKWQWPKTVQEQSIEQSIEEWIKSFKKWIKWVNERGWKESFYALKQEEKGPNLQNIVACLSPSTWISHPDNGLWKKLEMYIKIENLSKFISEQHAFLLFKYFMVSDKWYESDWNNLGSYDEISSEKEEKIEKLFNDVLKTLSDYILKGNAVQILTDSNLKEYFHPDLLKVFAFIANPDEALRYFYCSGELKIPDTLKEKPIKAIKKEFLPIRPEYTESHHLLGYYNPINKEYKYTKLLKFILEALKEYIEKSRCARPYVVCLDEMNIAQVEYYFADFLSVLQTSRIDETTAEDKKKEIKEDIKKLFNNEEVKRILQKDEIKEAIEKLLNSEEVKRILQKDVKLEKLNDHPLFGVTKEGITLSLSNQDYTLYLPPNLYFVGTINLDETTKSISLKVLDRAFVIEFDCDINEYFKGNNQNRNTQIKLDYLLFTNCGKFYSFSSDDYEKFKSELPDEIKTKIKNIWETLKKYGLHIGYRTLDQICAFIYSGLSKDSKVENELKFNSPEDALDYAIYSKILPRLAGPEQVLKDPLIELLGELVESKAKPNLKEKLKSSPLTFIPKVEKVEKVEKGKETEEPKETENVKKADVEYKFSLNRKEENGSENSFTTKYPLSVQKILEMLYKLETYNFASFI